MNVQLKEAIAVFELYMKLGFPQSEIKPVTDPKISKFGVQLIHKGQAAIAVIGPMEPGVDYQAAWDAAVIEWNRMSQIDRDVLLKATDVWDRKVDILAGLCKQKMYGKDGPA